MTVDIKAFYNAQAEIFKEFGVMGLRVEEPVPENESEPVFPKDVGELNLRELSSLMSKFTMWANYINSKLSLFTARKHEQERKIRLFKKAFERKYEGTKTEFDTTLMTDPEFIELDQTLLFLENSCTLLEAKQDIYLRYLKALSREITLRGINLEGEKYGGRI